ncbi:MAG: hypothetical protein QGF67_01090 [Lentisphaeria bacterium]|nr:hypothetical protein [Lentisphaeria bacterium]MDP7740005.1 hypothetical protein [Lentisphaeria bacterium]
MTDLTSIIEVVVAEIKGTPNDFVEMSDDAALFDIHGEELPAQLRPSGPVPGGTAVMFESLDGATVRLREQGAKTGRRAERPDKADDPGAGNGSCCKNAMLGWISFYVGRRAKKLLDFCHAMEQSGLASEAIFGKNSGAGTSWFTCWQRTGRSGVQDHCQATDVSQRHALEPHRWPANPFDSCDRQARTPGQFPATRCSQAASRDANRRHRCLTNRVKLRVLPKLPRRRHG